MKKWITLLLTACMCIGATVRLDWVEPTNNVQIEMANGVIDLGNTNAATLNLLAGQQYDLLLKSSGTPFLDLTIKPLYDPSSLIYLVIEGEDNTSGTNIIYASTNGVDYIFFSSSGLSEASYSFFLPQPATVKVWAKTTKDRDNEDSFYVRASVPDTKGVTNDIFDTAFPENIYGQGWVWRQLIGRGGVDVPWDTNAVYEVRNWNFPAGTNTITFSYREPRTELDKFVITSDISGNIPPSD